jgi:hypothetical protein
MAQIVIDRTAYEAIARGYWQIPSVLEMSLSEHQCPLNGSCIANHDVEARNSSVQLSFYPSAAWQ